MSTLSIVTVSLNQAKFLQQAVNSVQVQDPSRLRYVMVDPGSTDGARDIIRLNQKRFHKVLLEPDRGPAHGLNKGFAVAGGDILGYLNSDDRFLPGSLDYVLEMFDSRPYMDVLLGGIRIIDQFDRINFRKRTPDVFDVEKFLYRSCYFWQQATFFRREVFEAVGGFNADNRICWDGELIFDLHLHGARVAYTDVLLGDFRIHPNSITGSKLLREQNERELQRMRKKALTVGYPGLSPVRACLEQLRYKLNPARHLSYLFHGGVPSR